MQVMERVVGREAVATRWDELQSAAQHSLQMFVRPPYSVARWGQSESLQNSLLRRGGRSWVVYAHDALESERMVTHLRQMRNVSEQSRVVRRLPLKLAIVDRTTALVSNRVPTAAESVDTAFMIRASPALDALIALFDSYWLRGADATAVATVSSARSADEEAVLRLMAQGVKDEAIARQLGVSTPTVRRRIAAVMSELGVSTRFQAGLLLGSRLGGPVAAPQRDPDPES